MSYWPYTLLLTAWMKNTGRSWYIVDPALFDILMVWRGGVLQYLRPIYAFRTIHLYLKPALETLFNALFLFRPYHHIPPCKKTVNDRVTLKWEGQSNGRGWFRAWGKGFVPFQCMHTWLSVFTNTSWENHSYINAFVPSTFFKYGFFMVLLF